MRFLCLHGRGTNSDIFEAQLAGLRSRLPPQHTFDFLDANLDCSAAPGIGALFPPPYLSWYNLGGPDDVQSAHECLRSVIEEDGPYDGVVGFSEGAGVAVSLLLCNQWCSKPSPLFKVAILFNCVVPLSPSLDRGCNLAHVLGDDDRQWYLDLLPSTDPDDLSGETQLSAALALTSDCGLRIATPTLHVIGENDPFANSSRAVVELCEPGVAQVLVHEGGHELPPSEDALDRCAELFEMALSIASV